ncbi:hypothetical protein M2D07_031675, partial [Pseudomonas sp. BGr12]|uniref:hypothetical protein n=1 Tax=Pseudomonas sp. BGr12 TaxID=2936269 RepID=UPI002559BBDD
RRAFYANLIFRQALFFENFFSTQSLGLGELELPSAASTNCVLTLIDKAPDSEADRGFGIGA